MNFSEEEQEQIKSHLAVKRIRKKQYLLQAGDVCKVTAFVEKGALRSYTVDENGVEHITQFAIEGWFISDLYSMFSGEPSTLNIDAIEDSELVLISKASNEELLRSIPKFETFQREMITNAYIALQRRLSAIPTMSIDERYLTFMKQYPEIAQKVPQHMIASYLGLTPETLSRVRRRIAESK